MAKTHIEKYDPNKRLPEFNWELANDEWVLRDPQNHARLLATIWQGPSSGYWYVWARCNDLVNCGRDTLLEQAKEMAVQVLIERGVIERGCCVDGKVRSE